MIFLDITMAGENGFQLLNSLEQKDIKVVFVTAHNEFTMQAIKASAVDYLLKQVRIDELQKAVGKIKLSVNNPLTINQNRLLLQHFLDVVNKKMPVQKIAVPQLGSIRFVELDEIVSLQADSNYTIIQPEGYEETCNQQNPEGF